MDWIVDDEDIQAYHQLRKVKFPIYMLFLSIAVVLALVLFDEGIALFILFGVFIMLYAFRSLSGKGRYGQFITRFTMDDEHISIEYLKGGEPYHISAPKVEFSIYKYGIEPGTAASVAFGGQGLKLWNAPRVKIYHLGELLITQYELGPWDHRAFGQMVNGLY